MNRAFTLFSALLVAAFCNAQIVVQSTCTTNDSITRLYRKDADRLALRNTYLTNNNYKDSLQIAEPLSNSYLRALIAVYNATAIPARDTVINTFNIHTNVSPELNSLSVVASSTLNWMKQLLANATPTTNPPLVSLMNNFALQYTYYQSSANDKVVFTSDSNLNMVLLPPYFSTLTGVTSAVVEQQFNDVKNISDVQGAGFITLNYSIGWGSCEDTCDYRKNWQFKVYSDCRVEYMGTSGSPLYTGLTTSANIPDLTLFPNPATRQLYFDLDDRRDAVIIIRDITGRMVMTSSAVKGRNAINIHELENGIYFLSLSDGETSAVARFVKQ